jgi:hypothetical protein
MTGIILFYKLVETKKRQNEMQNESKQRPTNKIKWKQNRKSSKSETLTLNAN